MTRQEIRAGFIDGNFLVLVPSRLRRGVVSVIPALLSLISGIVIALFVSLSELSKRRGVIRDLSLF